MGSIFFQVKISRSMCGLQAFVLLILLLQRSLGEVWPQVFVLCPKACLLLLLYHTLFSSAVAAFTSPLSFFFLYHHSGLWFCTASLPFQTNSFLSLILSAKTFLLCLVCALPTDCVWAVNHKRLTICRIKEKKKDWDSIIRTPAFIHAC